MHYHFALIFFLEVGVAMFAADAQEQTYVEVAISAISTSARSLDEQRIDVLFDELNIKLQHANGEEYIAPMLRAVWAIQGNVSGPLTSIQQKCAKRILERASDQNPEVLEGQFSLLPILRMAREKSDIAGSVRLHLQLLSRLHKQIDLDWHIGDPRDLVNPYQPPITYKGSFRFGMDPSGIDDEKVRNDYATMLKRRNEVNKRVKDQTRLREIDKKYRCEAENYLIQVFSADSAPVK